jgi:DNA-binding GntR family transcriptional regulator
MTMEPKARANRKVSVSRRAGEQAPSVVEGIIEYIKESIRNGRFVAGQRLIESEIQLAVGSSRGPVREAMRRLAAEGLLDIPHYKGARVRRVTRSEVEDHYRVRGVLEGLAARLAAGNLDQNENLAKLLKLESDHKRSFDGTAQVFMNYNVKFHELIVGMSGGELLIRLVKQLQTPVFTVQLYAIIDREMLEDANRQHQKIVKALFAGDGRGAESAMREHIRSTCGHVLKRGAKLFD